jgi:hypothetical protein
LDGGTAHRKTSVCREQHTEEKSIHIDVEVGFEPSAGAAETFYALQLVASVIGPYFFYNLKFNV